MQLERAIGIEKQRRLEQEEKVKELKAELRKAYEVNMEIQNMQKKLHVMASSISDQILPQTKKIMNLK